LGQQPADGRRAPGRARSPVRRFARRFVRRARQEDGQALVEMALVMPFLLLLLTAIIQFGIMFSDYTDLTDAARTGARELALGRGLSDPCDLAVKQTVESTAGSVALQDSQVTPSFGSSSDYCGSTSPGTACTPYVYDSSCNANGNENLGDEATVSISYPYTITVFGMHIINVNLSTSASDAIE
jgi:Flp pilus assembly protein TadG